MKLILCCTAAFWEMHRVSWGNHTTLLTPGVLTTRNMCLGFTLWCLTHTSISQSWSDPILDQNKKEKKKKKNLFHLIKEKMWESEFLPLPLGRETPERASRTELFPELWSPITAIAGKDRSFSIPRALRLSTRSMQGRIFSSYWLYKECSAAC